MRPTAWLAQAKAIANMAVPLSQTSIQALHRLRTYTPPPTQWHNCPLPRRAAVLILLFPDKKGELKVVLTVRSKTMRNYAGQVALPGGKSDTLEESPWDTSRREAFEEIGLPMTDEKLKGFQVEHLCELPTNLAKTELGVRPCVAFLHPSTTTEPIDVEEKLIPRLDPKEVAAVFTAPFHNFLRKEWQGTPPLPPNSPKWYKGMWTDWHESRWRMHNFYLPRTASEPGEPTFFRVFGMTARILVDAARVAYAEEPDFEHNSHHGDEEMIERLLRMGRLSGERVRGEVLTREVLREASKM